MKKIVSIIVIIVSFLGVGVGCFFLGKVVFDKEDNVVVENDGPSVYLGKNNEYVYYDEAKKVELGEAFVNKILYFRTVGPDAVTREEFFANSNYSLSFVGSYYADAEGDQTTVTKKDFILKNVKDLFNVEIDSIGEVKSINVTNGYSFGDMSCISEYCYIFAAAGGEMYGPEYVNTVINQETVDGNTVYTVKEFYMGYGENGKRDIFVKKDGELLLASSEISEYEELVKVVSADKLNTYKFTFDKDGKFVSCVKVK